MRLNPLQSTERLVSSACAGMLSSIGLRGSPRDRADLERVLRRPDEYAAGIIGFTGDAVSGKVVLLSDFEFFARTRTIAGSPGVLQAQSAADWIRARDWTMELSNQLLGRIKRQLCTFGIIVETSLPKAVSGHALVVTLRERKTAPVVMAADRHDVVVWFEAVSKQSAIPGPCIEPLGEGELITF
jgi:hypothetical protein